MERGLLAKRSGGLGVHDLEVKNLALLGKWLFKLLTEDGVWQTLFKRKYVGTKALSQVLWKPRDSHFLGRPDGYEEGFLPLWYFFDQRWITLARE
jgi:hypothetical protein